MGFQFADMAVLMERRRITAIGADSEAKARMLIKWLDERLQGYAERW